jgi:hypothetical protein
LKLVPQLPEEEQLHTLAIKKSDVAIVASALAFFYANRDTAKVSGTDAEQIKGLFEFFKNVYNSKGAI